MLLFIKNTSYLFVIAKNWKPDKCPSFLENGYTNCCISVYTMDYHSEVKRKKLLIHMTLMDLKRILLSEKKKPISKGYILYDFIYIILSQ